MLFKSLITFLTLFQLALAASITIESPKPNAVLTAGKTFEIKWKTPSNPGFETVNIALASGPAQALLIDRVIATNVAAANGTYKWKVPKTLKPGKQYVIEIGPHAADIAFAGYITIQAERKASSSSIHPSSSHAKNHAKPTATLPSSVAAAKPTASSHASDSVKGHVICRAFPDEKNGKISTTCRPAPTTTKTHGTHKRKAAQKTSSAKKAEKTEPAAEEAPSYTYRVALPSVDVSI
ncbi:hypothetical protein VTP01DRAFT_386 [Rhizomucor pusillus]|uniref:uncharacterized protein n=1 Tax=Rhizomucor pusillus TaxID=4840 RepID=UPI003743F4A1